MRIFIERFLLAILAAIAVLLAVTNPMGWSTTPRIVGVIAVVILAAIAACFAEKYGELRWDRVRRLWRRKTENRYLDSTDTDLGSAIKIMVWVSAWGNGTLLRCLPIKLNQSTERDLTDTQCK